MNVIRRKICLLGDFAVGKTSLVRWSVEGRFENKYLSSIGVKISRKTVVRPASQLNLLVWDLAGSEEFNSQSDYLRGAAGALLVCDLTRRETLASFERYVLQVRTVNATAPLVVVGNKADLVADRAITEAEMQEVCTALGSPYFMSSAKTGEHVDAIFLCLAELLEVVS